MSGFSRREFFSRAAAGAAAAGLATEAMIANPLGMPIGCQTYPVREMLAQDFPRTVKQLADAGFQRIELCSPIGYKEFAVVGKYKGAELKKILGDAGVKCESSHFSMRELRTDQAKSLEWAKDAGLKQVLVASLGGQQAPTMDDVKRAADEYNKIAEVTAKAGMQQGLHNENFEMATVDGKPVYDLLFDLLDPKLVKFQFQVSTISRGFVAADYFKKYPGRFISMHVQDWDADAKKVTAVGKGSIDWKKTFAAAKAAGIKNYFVEMNLELMKESVPYLRDLKV